MLLEDNPGRFEPFLSGDTETNAPKYTVPRRLRLYRVAETYVTMLNAGVSVFRGDKPDLFAPNFSERIWITAPVFYGSREVKAAGVEMTTVHNSRAVGVLVTAHDVFAVYNTGDSLMKWDYKPELRLRAVLTQKITRERLIGEHSVHALMLGSDMAAAVTLMTSRKRNYFVLDGDFSSFSYITNDRYGETLLRLMRSPEQTSELNALLSANLSPPNPGALVENDAMDGDTPVLFAYMFDMPRIARFNAALRLHKRSGAAICFDYQADALKSVCGDSVTIQTIDFDKFKRRFFP